VGGDARTVVPVGIVQVEGVGNDADVLCDDGMVEDGAPCCGICWGLDGMS